MALFSKSSRAFVIDLALDNLSKFFQGSAGADTRYQRNDTRQLGSVQGVSQD
jgi:hypothetical protein